MQLESENCILTAMFNLSIVIIRKQSQFNECHKKKGNKTSRFDSPVIIK
jgi:hypothetical protein